MRAYVVTGIFLLILITGCISPEIPEGNPQEYELPGIVNNTIFYLNTSYVQVVESVSNATELRLDMSDTADITINNPVAVDYSGKNVSFNVSKEVIFGKSYVFFKFKSPFTGFVAYSQQDGQDFSRMLTKNVSVRVVLPKNFTTGSRFFGIANPEPDNTTIDESGREVLIWEKPYPEKRVVSVKYYHKSAPAAVGNFFALIFASAILLLLYYYLTIKKLKKKRVKMEQDITKK